MVDDSDCISAFKDGFADALVITGAHASPEQPLSNTKDTPFVSGQAYKKGFFWYDDPAKKAKLKKKRFCHQPVLLSSPSKVGKGRFKFKMAKREYAPYC
ncbi:hypothetical protein ACLB1E_34145 [Escherichia coli]